MKRYLLRFYGVKGNKIYFLLLALLIGVFSYILYTFVFPIGTTKCYTIEEGDKVEDIVDKMYLDGVVRNRRLALIYLRLTGNDKKIMPVTFCVRVFDNLVSVFAKLKQKGANKVIVPEGLDSFELASFLERERVIKRKEDFIKVVFDREIASRILKKYDLPGFVLEGYLFPGVYYFSDSLPSEIVAERMVKNFVKKALPEIKRSGKPLYELLIIASIVQKETYYSDEMPIVAGVFYNRLRRNMPLQADPTVIYARRMETSGKYKGPPKKADLTIDSPYNTYNRIGLPPTPISNPGIDAIRASINPAKTKYLYFVSMGNGTHFFSSDLNAHNRAVERFLKGNGEALKE